MMYERNAFFPEGRRLGLGWCCCLGGDFRWVGGYGGGGVKGFRDVPPTRYSGGGGALPLVPVGCSCGGVLVKTIDGGALVVFQAFLCGSKVVIPPVPVLHGTTTSFSVSGDCLTHYTDRPLNHLTIIRYDRFLGLFCKEKTRTMLPQFLASC